MNFTFFINGGNDDSDNHGVVIMVIKKQANPGPGTVSLSSNASKSGPSPLLTGISVSMTMY